MAGTTITSCSPCTDCTTPTLTPVVCTTPVYTANSCPQNVLTDCVTYTGADNTCIGVTSSGTPMTLTQVIIAIVSYLSGIWTRLTSNSLAVTVGGSCSNQVSVELVPSSQPGNILILGNDGKPYVPQLTVSLLGSKCISFQNSGTAQNELWVPVLDFGCISNNVTTQAINCISPANAATGSITTTGASISFTAIGGNVYDIILNGTVIATSITSPYALSGLAPNTNYSVAIRADCPSGSTSETLLTFSTLPVLTCNAPSNLQITTV